MQPASVRRQLRNETEHSVSRVRMALMLRKYWKTLVAVLGGNFLYFVVLFPMLPPAARHRPSQLDWGIVIDFWICLAIYGLLAMRRS